MIFKHWSNSLTVWISPGALLCVNNNMIGVMSILSLLQASHWSVISAGLSYWLSLSVLSGNICTAIHGLLHGTPIINQIPRQYSGYTLYSPLMWHESRVRVTSNTWINGGYKTMNGLGQIKIYISVSTQCYQTKYNLSIPSLDLYINVSSIKTHII